jgi:hypothetical protein
MAEGAVKFEIVLSAVMTPRTLERGAAVLAVGVPRAMIRAGRGQLV